MKICVQRGVNITCEADPQLSEAAERYTHVSSKEDSTLLINKLKKGNYHSSGPEPRKALLDTIGIAPGTAFEDLPDDWSCPLCGVGKDMFEPA